MNWIDLAEVALEAWGLVIVVAALGYAGWRVVKQLRK